MKKTRSLNSFSVTVLESEIRVPRYEANSILTTDKKKKNRFLRNAIRVIGIRFLCFGYKILYVHSSYLISRRNLFKSTTPNPILILASDADGNSTLKENMLSWHKCCFDEKCLHKLKPTFHVTWCHARPPTYCSLFIAFRVIDLIYVIVDSKKGRWMLNASKQTLWSNLHFSSVYLCPQNRKVSTFIDQDATQSGFFWKNIRYETT